MDVDKADRSKEVLLVEEIDGVANGVKAELHLVGIETLRAHNLREAEKIVGEHGAGIDALVLSDIPDPVRLRCFRALLPNALVVVSNVNVESSGEFQAVHPWQLARYLGRVLFESVPH